MERSDDRQVEWQLERLLDAVLTIGSDLDLHTVLHTIIQTATESVGATYGALGVLDEVGDRLIEFVTIGIDGEAYAAIGQLPQGHGILGLLIAEPKPLRLPDLTQHPASYGFPPNHPPMTSFLGAPIAIRGHVFGNIYLCDKVGGGEFTDDDEAFVVNLASVASLAIENARLHARVAELATFEDRERIARDLHDTVIQRLFAVGLSLQATQRLVDDPIVSSRSRHRRRRPRHHRARHPRGDLRAPGVASQRSVGASAAARPGGAVGAGAGLRSCDPLRRADRRGRRSVARRGAARGAAGGTHEHRPRTRTRRAPRSASACATSG